VKWTPRVSVYTNEISYNTSKFSTEMSWINGVGGRLNCRCGFWTQLQQKHCVLCSSSSRDHPSRFARYSFLLHGSPSIMLLHDTPLLWLVTVPTLVSG